MKSPHSILLLLIAAALALPAVAQPAESAPPAGHYVHSQRSSQWVERRLSGRDDTVAGEVTSPHPTLVNLSLEWRIEGDDDLDGTVAVAYRAAGETAWRHALPLRRVPGGAYVSRDPRSPFSTARWDNMHAGSILDLTPGTEYEVSLRLTDPDGGAAERTLRVCTRAVPADMPGARVRRVNTANFRAEAAHAEPGDVLLLAPGNYGFHHAERDGTPGKPIVFRADPEDFGMTDRTPAAEHPVRGWVQFDGFSLAGRSHVHLEGVLSTDSIDLFGAEDCVVRRCLVQALWGIVSGWTSQFADFGPRVPRLPPGRPAAATGCRDCLIADNVVTGATPWLPMAQGFAGKNRGEGIQISGPGNVVCHNRVSGFRDSISLMEGSFATDQTSVDIYNNDVSVGLDDGIEADYAGTNCRIVRNRITNCSRGLALAPALGGPVYVVRNVFFNTGSVWQFGRAGVGYVALHNTSVKSGPAFSVGVHGQAFGRNNLFLGTAGRGGREDRAHETILPALDYDYDGIGLEQTPAGAAAARIVSDPLATMRARGFEGRGIRVGLEVFQTSPRIPDGLFPEQTPPDFTLKPGTAAVDAGQALPNINDGFAGRAPDLGALELGAAAPVYGPRPEEWK